MWRPAAAARNRAPGGPGPRPPSTTTWLRGARCTGCGGNAADGSAAPGRKIATVERRKARVLRYWTQGVSQTPGLPRFGRPAGCRCIWAPVGAPPTPRVGNQFQDPGAMCCGNEECCAHGLFDIVKMDERAADERIRRPSRDRRGRSVEAPNPPAAAAWPIACPSGKVACKAGTPRRGNSLLGWLRVVCLGGPCRSDLRSHLVKE